MDEQKPISNYSEVKKELVPIFPESERTEINAILNKDIIIYEFRAMPSSLAAGKEYVLILAELDNKKVSFPCGEVVLKQLKDVANKLPIRAKIIRQKGKRYYTLS